MNATEQLMLEVMAELSLSNAPIIFKGAMLLKLALAEQSIPAITRITRDIDGDWYAKDARMEQMKDCLSAAASRVSSELSVVSSRPLTENTSAGFKVMNNDGDLVFRVDFGKRCHAYTSTYHFQYKGQSLSICGASLSKMLADKICAISSPKIFQRSKDLLDAYLLSYCSGFRFHEVFQIADSNGRKVDDFHAFRENREDLLHAYNKLQGIENKPDFSVVYERLHVFLVPFILGQMQDSYWTGAVWQPVF